MTPAPLVGHPRVRLGRLCEVGRDVEVIDLAPNGPPMEIGDCARIGDGVRFVLGSEPVRFGDYLTLHERCLVLARGRLTAGHNVWCARHVELDSTGGLTLGNGVRIGAGSQLWTHAEAGEELEGCLLNSWQPTTIGEGAWLVGRVDVNPGVEIAERAVVANGSVVVRSLDVPWALYAGNPARRMPGRPWSMPTLNEKREKMRAWCREFATSRSSVTSIVGEDSTALLADDGSSVVIVRGSEIREEGPTVTTINLSTQTYRKRFTPLEVAFLRWLDGRRARFIPI